MYTKDLAWVYHFDFYQARILKDIDDLVAWKTPDHKLKKYLLVFCPTRNTNTSDNRSSHTSNSLLASIEVYFK